MLVVAAAAVWQFRIFKQSPVPAPDRLRGGAAVQSRNASQAEARPEAKLRGEARPHLALHKIVQFGRTLELVGSAEAGSRLTVNNESIEVSGDGSFKHFTKPFTESGDRVRLEIKATDLAGRTRNLTAFHSFHSSGENR